MQVSVTSNAPEYRNALLEWMANFGKNARQAVKYQGRLLGERVVAFTPPRNEAQGRARTTKDIHKVMLGLDKRQMSRVQQLKEDQTTQLGGGTYFRLFKARDGGMTVVQRDLYMPRATRQELGAFHQSKRGKYGRVEDKHEQMLSVGKWRILKKLVVPKELLTAYDDAAQGRVGRGKAGWALGVLRLGGRVAAWVARHAGATGQFKDGLATANPSVEFINKSEWAKGGDQDRIMQNAIKARTRDIRNSISKARKDASKSIFK
jgi:hypothetical protein